MRVLINRIGQQTALIISDITGRRTDQAADAVPLHIFGHIEPLQLYTHDRGELARDFGFTDPGGPAKQERANGFVRIAQTRPAQLHSR